MVTQVIIADEAVVVVFFKEEVYNCEYITSDRIANMSCDTSFPTILYVRPAKAQTSLRICAVWSVPLLVAWIFYNCLATDGIAFGLSKLKRRLHMLVWVYTCQNALLLEITCHGSYMLNASKNVTVYNITLGSALAQL